MSSVFLWGRAERNDEKDFKMGRKTPFMGYDVVDLIFLELEEETHRQSSLFKRFPHTNAPFLHPLVFSLFFMSFCLGQLVIDLTKWKTEVSDVSFHLK